MAVEPRGTPAAIREALQEMIDACDRRDVDQVFSLSATLRGDEARAYCQRSDVSADIALLRQRVPALTRWAETLQDMAGMATWASSALATPAALAVLVGPLSPLIITWVAIAVALGGATRAFLTFRSAGLRAAAKAADDAAGALASASGGGGAT